MEAPAAPPVVGGSGGAPGSESAPSGGEESDDNRGRAYFREVVLELDGSLKPVEFGATKVNLDLFPAGAHEAIRREERPLGGILHDFNIAFSSHPAAFFRLTADSFIRGALGLPCAPLLFARRNTLLDNQSRAMAEIVEILPP